MTMIESSRDALLALAEAGYAAALSDLSDPEPRLTHRAVAQLSGHLAVMRRAVLPAARHHLEPCAPAQCLAQGRQIEWALRLLEGRLSGEACAARLSLEAVAALLEQRLAQYRAVERALLAALRERMPAHEHERLARRCQILLAAAPTRPHPRSPRRRLPAMLAFRILGGLDRLLDTMDSRPDPRPLTLSP